MHKKLILYFLVSLLFLSCVRGTKYKVIPKYGMAFQPNEKLLVISLANVSRDVNKRYQVIIQEDFGRCNNVKLLPTDLMLRRLKQRAVSLPDYDLQDTVLLNSIAIVTEADFILVGKYLNEGGNNGIYNYYTDRELEYAQNIPNDTKEVTIGYKLYDVKQKKVLLELIAKRFSNPVAIGDKKGGDHNFNLSSHEELMLGAFDKGLKKLITVCHCK